MDQDVLLITTLEEKLVNELYYEIENFLTEEELEIVDNNILSNEFPWFYHQDSTSSRFPFFAHVIYSRINEESEGASISNSSLSHFVNPIVKRFSEKYLHKENIVICRSALNCTIGWNNEYEYTEPHVDHKFNHLNLIVYLNDDYDSGETILFNRYLCESDKKYCYSVDEYDELQPIAKITPKKGKAVVFDGRIFHAMSNMNSNKKRVILVTTLK